MIFLILPLFNNKKLLEEIIFNQCSIDKDQDCITLEDFIMPPTNIPVVIRDGMVKTDVPIYINRNNLLFANSKNIFGISTCAGGS